MSYFLMASVLLVFRFNFGRGALTSETVAELTVGTNGLGPAGADRLLEMFILEPAVFLAVTFPAGNVAEVVGEVSAAVSVANMPMALSLPPSPSVQVVDKVDEAVVPEPGDACLKSNGRISQSTRLEMEFLICRIMDNCRCWNCGFVRQSN